MPGAALYIRVSTDKQEELSPDAQKRLLLEYANRNQYDVDDAYIFIENGISGRYAEKRPEFKRMISLAKTKPKPFDVILVWKFSRFARNREDSIIYKSMLRKQYEIDVISITEQLGDSKISILIEAMLEAMDEYYSINLSEEVFKGMSENAMRGRFQSKSPYGYRLSHDKRKLEINLEEAQNIKMIYHLFAYENKSEYEIAKYLNCLNIKTACGNSFESRSIRYILENPIYAGYVRWNRTHANQLKQENEWIISKGSHEAIIEEKLYATVVKKIAKPKTNISRPSCLKKHWLSGLLKCSHCGRSLCYSSITNKKTGKTYGSFQCYGYQKGLCEESHCISEQKVILGLSEHFKTYYHQFETGYIFPCKNPDDENLELLQNRLLALTKKEERIKEAYLSNIDSLSEYKENKEKLAKEKNEINTAIENVLNKNETKGQINLVHNLYELMVNTEIPNPIKNKALLSIIEKIVYVKKEGQLTIYYR